MNTQTLLDLRPTNDPLIWEMPVTHAICGGRDSIYGGCALASAIEVAERCTGRSTTWATCQFLAPAHLGQTVQLSAHISATGRAVSHIRVVASCQGEELFVVLASLGERNFPTENTWVTMPQVPDPLDCPPRYILASHKGGFREHIEERVVTDDPGGVMHAPDGRCAIWITMPGGIEANAASLALIGDEVSAGTSAVIENDAQAISIDNTLRIVKPMACEWVLADIEVRAASRGFAHGFVNLWSPDGQLLAIATQTGALRTRGK